MPVDKCQLLDKCSMKCLWEERCQMAAAWCQLILCTVKNMLEQISKSFKGVLLKNFSFSSASVWKRNSLDNTIYQKQLQFSFFVKCNLFWVFFDIFLEYVFSKLFTSCRSCSFLLSLLETSYFTRAHCLWLQDLVWEKQTSHALSQSHLATMICQLSTMNCQLSASCQLSAMVIAFWFHRVCRGTCQLFWMALAVESTPWKHRIGDEIQALYEEWLSTKIILNKMVSFEGSLNLQIVPCQEASVNKKCMAPMIASLELPTEMSEVQVELAKMYEVLAGVDP